MSQQSDCEYFPYEEDEDEGDACVYINDADQPPAKRARIEDGVGAGQEDNFEDIAQLHDAIPAAAVQPVNQQRPVNQQMQGEVGDNNRLTFAIDSRVVYHSKQYNVDGVDFKVRIVSPPHNTPYREVMDAIAQVLERIFNARMRVRR